MNPPPFAVGTGSRVDDTGAGPDAVNPSPDFKASADIPQQGQFQTLTHPGSQESPASAKSFDYDKELGHILSGYTCRICLAAKAASPGSASASDKSVPPKKQVNSAAYNKEALKGKKRDSVVRHLERHAAKGVRFFNKALAQRPSDMPEHRKRIREQKLESGNGDARRRDVATATHGSENTQPVGTRLTFSGDLLDGGPPYDPWSFSWLEYVQTLWD